VDATARLFALCLGASDGAGEEFGEQVLSLL
jgi:hypothetical protein